MGVAGRFRVAFTADFFDSDGHPNFRDMGQVACQSMIDLAHGRRPHEILNPEVFDRPSFQKNGSG